ncbi:MAG TPA: excinuclease ABC subunit UvrC [Dehalococcoidia bacterium]|nr:excinuclease ABC subunit UvrC [Dehalococcoidia bacterium]
MRSIGLKNSVITEQLDNMPTGPGVYLMKNTQGDILYVGKAASLRHRVRSYFAPGQKLTPKLERMVAQVNDIDFFLTASEHEALILELNLIKRHHPPYNVRLKDDKTFPYLKIDTAEDWPRVQVTRRLLEDGARYFGPFASARSLRQTLKVIRRVFPFRSCSRNITGRDSRPCLEYYVNNCLAPCIGAVSSEEYNKVIKDLILFLEGKQESVLRKLENEMQQTAEALNFEKAAILRDQVQAARDVIEGQKIAIKLSGEQDVIALASDRDQTCAQVFFIRGGKLIGRESFTLRGTRYEEPQIIMTSFVKQFYDSSPYIPPRLLLQYPLEDRAIVEDWLQGKRGSRVRILVPQRGSKKQLVDIAVENARQGLEQSRIKQQKTVLEAALTEIQKELELPAVPARIEGYDISNIQGTAAAGSMVVFEQGRPKPAHYRRFRIKTVSGANDYAMLQEVLQRRFKRAVDAANGWAIRPDLVLIDGGKGQLNAARTVMEAAGIPSVPVASLAKEDEAIFLPRRARPIILPRQSPGLQLLQRVRDEAHRFALGYHHQRHTRETFASVLDSVPGIGAKRKHALLRRFGSIQAIRDASVAELAATGGMNQGLAEKIKQYV